MDVGSFLVANTVGETDSTKRRSVPLPTAIDPVHCHVQCYASPTKAGYRGRADLGGLPPRHNHGRLTRNPDDTVDARALPAMVGWHQRARALAANRYDWLR